MKSFTEFLKDRLILEDTQNFDINNKNKLLKLFQNNKGIKVKEVKDYCKKNNIWENDLIEIMSVLMNEFVSYSIVEKVSGELDTGRKIESEHKETWAWIREFHKKNEKIPSDTEIQEHIAKDHLKENKNYYSYLKDMEEKVEKKKLTLK